MSRKSLPLLCAALALLILGASACAAAKTNVQAASATEPPAPPASGATFSDPFAYCAAVGTIDQPDARYTGPKITDAIINGYLKAAGLEGTGMPADLLKKSTLWRCMDKKVYACNVGANLPCASKANTDKTPTQAMIDYCKESPNSDFIPMSVTGHSTIYSWHCVKDTPELLDQTDQVDAAGYLSRIWYPIEPKP